jgi:anti-sigma factor RsiW
MDDVNEDQSDERRASRDTYELDELLGAYALDAVDPDERRRVEDYLAVNPRAAAEVQEHREVATMLAFTGMDAPEDLWSRIERELEESPPSPGPELAKVLALDADRPESGRSASGRRRRLASIGPWVATAAAAAVIAVVAIGVVDRGGGPSDPLEQAYVEARADRDSGSATLVAEGQVAVAEAVIDQDGHGFVDASALPMLADGKTYQLWGVVASTGDAISLGIFGPNPEIEPFTTESSLSALALTIEDHPGVISDGNQDGWYVGTVG